MFCRQHRRALSTAIGALVTISFFYYVVPRLVGLGPTLRLLRHGDVWWLALGVVLEAFSLFGGIVLFRGVFGRAERRIGWRVSYRITMAGTAATKIVAPAGAGGIALTVWALHGYGMSGAEIANGMICFEILTYAVYTTAIALAGYGLWLGVFWGQAPVELTLVPAIMATAVMLIVLSMLLVDGPAERFLKRRAERSRGRTVRWWQRAAVLPRSIRAGLMAAIDMIRRRDPSLLGAPAYWGFDIAVLWVSFRAFGRSPPGAVIVLSYYLGTLGNALPAVGEHGEHRRSGRHAEGDERADHAGLDAADSTGKRLPTIPGRDRLLAPCTGVQRTARPVSSRGPKPLMTTVTRPAGEQGPLPSSGATPAAPAPLLHSGWLPRPPLRLGPHP